LDTGLLVIEVVDLVFLLDFVDEAAVRVRASDVDRFFESNCILFFSTTA
jgi:hypothetical protein